MAKLTLYNVGIGMIVAVGTFGYGFGFGVFITSIGQPGFYKDFNLDRKQHKHYMSGTDSDIRAATSDYTARYAESSEGHPVG